jgi:4-amino-4-deoxy-L-arabinose transferase-like glycosyltransferase
MLGFAAVLALNLLTKGLIGIVFPLAFAILYLAFTHELPLLRRLSLIPSTILFLALALPWHILAALRNPPIAMPAGLGLPAKAGWAWFYLYNEHIARFLGKRIPHDYGQTPVWLFWLFLAIWIMPWAAFIPSALADRLHDLRNYTSPRAKEAALALILWTVLVLGFFSLSSRQEYYSLPAIPALALMAGCLLAQADAYAANARRRALHWHLYFLIPLTTLIAAVCGYFALTAPHAAHGTDISTLLDANPAFYNLSLGHLFDLTGAAMGLFRGPLTAVALSMLGIGLGSYLLRRKSFTYAANLTLAVSMIVTLLAAHEGLVRFYPTLGSKPIAEAINRAEAATSSNQRPLIILDGEMTSGSTLIFYTRQQVHLVDGRVNGLWYGSFWPDAPHVFETNTTLHQLWSGPRRIFLMTSDPQRAADLKPFGPIYKLASSGGKTLLSNQN